MPPEVVIKSGEAPAPLKPEIKVLVPIEPKMDEDENIPSSIKLRKLLKMLYDRGFEEVSQKGSHVKLTNGERLAIVPVNKPQLKEGTLKSILNMAGMDKYYH